MARQPTSNFNHALISSCRNATRVLCHNIPTRVAMAAVRSRANSVKRRAQSALGTHLTVRELTSHSPCHRRSTLYVGLAVSDDEDDGSVFFALAIAAVLDGQRKASMYQRARDALVSASKRRRLGPVPRVRRDTPLDPMHLPPCVFEARFRFPQQHMLRVLAALRVPDTVRVAAGTTTFECSGCVALCMLCARYIQPARCRRTAGQRRLTSQPWPAPRYTYPSRAHDDLPMLFKTSWPCVDSVIASVEGF